MVTIWRTLGILTARMAVLTLLGTMTAWIITAVCAHGQVAQRVTVAAAETRIVPGCELSITVEGEPDVSHPYTVDARGLVHFAIADSTGVNKQEWDVLVAGKNAAGAKAALQQSLAKYFKDPEVRVSIVRLPGVHVEVTGEVQRQGVYLLPFDSRVSDLLLTAPTKPMADITNILVRRASGQATATGPATFNIDLTLAASDENDDPKLQEGDRIFIRRRAETPAPAALQIVRVVGEINYSVGSSGPDGARAENGVAIPVGGDMKLKDVIERAGGLKESADRSHLYLGRLDGTTQILSADKIEAGDADQNIKVRAGDLVIVPKRDRSQVYAVLGEVNAPNTFPYRAGTKLSLLQAIAGAGDLSKKADRHRGILSRGFLLDPTKAKPIAFDPELVKKGEQPNMEIEPGDAVIIEQRKKRPTFWQQILPLALHFLPF